MSKLRRPLEALRKRLNRRKYVSPDPLQFLYEYEDPADLEVVGMIASSLAYGRVAQILRSVRGVLDRLGPSPARRLAKSTPGALRRLLDGFKHRFTTGDEMASMLAGVRNMLGTHGTLERAFASNIEASHDTVMPALGKFATELWKRAGTNAAHLVPLPERGSACKRLHLFLRWMIRKDEVDVGCWTSVPASKLIVPLDTHMHRICGELGFRTRQQADSASALAVTAAFRMIAPDDPVRYDFALTRLGIRKDTDLCAFLDECRGEAA